MIRPRGKNHLDKKVRKALLCAAVLLPLAACGGTGAGDHPSQSAPPPPMAGETIKPLAMPGGTSAGTPTLGPVTPPGADGKPVEPAKPETIAPIPTPMETFRALAPPEGLKVTPLFAEPVKDTDARIARVEKAVQDLRNDFDTVMPAMVRMVAMESNMRDLIDQMKAVNDSTHTTPTPAAMPGTAAATPAAPAAPLPAPAPAKQDDKKAEAKPAAAAEKPAVKEAAPVAVATPAKTPGAASVKAIRLGDHDTTTRVVLELSAKAAVPATIDNDGKQLVVDLAQVNWTGKDSGGMKAGKLVSSWKYDGGKLHIGLLHPAVIKSQKLLGPGAGSKDFRLVIELAADTQAAAPARPAEAAPAPASAPAAAPAPAASAPVPAPADTAKPAGG